MIVDDLAPADQLKQALATHTESGAQGSPVNDTAQALAALLVKYEVCCDLRVGDSADPEFGTHINIRVGSK